MSNVKSYTFLAQMPSIFNWYKYGYGYYDVDLLANPEGYDEKDLLRFFWGMFGPIGVDDKHRFSKIPQIETLLNRYNYSLDHTYEYYVDEEFVSIEFTLSTNAKGQHLVTILDACYDEIMSGHGEYAEAMNEAKMKARGWQHIEVEDFEDCPHTKTTRLQIMNDKDGSIVEVLECKNPKCKELIKRVI